MLNAFSGLFKKKTQVWTDELASQEEFSADSHILVPRSAFDARNEEPAKLVGAVVDYVNFLTQQARYQRAEICEAAMWAYHTDFYLAQVNNGGHEQFILNSRRLLDVVLADVLFGLKSMNAKEHLMLARRMSQWVLEHEDALHGQSPLPTDGLDPLVDLDQPFFALESLQPMVAKNAAWLATHPALRVVSDEDLDGELEKIAAANPHLAIRSEIQTVQSLNAMISQYPSVSIAAAAGAQSKPQPLVAIGGGAMMEVEGKQRLTFTVRTVAGLKWCAVTDEGAALYERLDQEEAADLSDVLNATMDDISGYEQPEVGERLSFVSAKQIEAAALIAQRLDVGAAIHLLLQKIEQPTKVNYLTIRSAGPDHNGVLGMSLLVVLNNMSVAMSVIVTEHHAILLEEPTHQEIARVSMEDVAAYAESLAPEQL